MRTKALILSAMIGVAGIASSFAQVYSVNVVGYINLTLTNTFSLIANQLDNGNGNLVTNMFTGLPNQTVFYKFNGATYDSLTYITGTPVPTWSAGPNRLMTLAPGEGVFVKKPTTAPSISVTFVGEVLQGDLVNPVAVGFDMYSAMVPQEGGITTVHAYTASNQDTVYEWLGTGWSTARVWLGTAVPPRWNVEPILQVGEAVFINSRAAKNWTRTFTVN
jgi:hypothetical protein